MMLWFSADEIADAIQTERLSCFGAETDGSAVHSVVGSDAGPASRSSSSMMNSLYIITLLAPLS